MGCFDPPSKDGRSNPSATSWCGSLLLFVSDLILLTCALADDVIALEGPDDCVVLTSDDRHTIVVRCVNAYPTGISATICVQHVNSSHTWNMTVSTMTGQCVGQLCHAPFLLPRNCSRGIL